jgi:predicted cupin superfamily sugar epimerase
MTSEQIISELQLQPHPEGGFYKETYRSGVELELHGFQGKRQLATGIYYLVVAGHISAFHRIKQDEMWHFYKGGSLELHIIRQTGVYDKIILGNQLAQGEVPQYLVEAGDYFAACVQEGTDYALMGCTVSPGFDFRDFEMPSRAALIRQFPEQEAIITHLTHD